VPLILPRLVYVFLLALVAGPLKTTVRPLPYVVLQALVAGLFVGAVVFLAGATRLIDALSSLVPVSVIRGVQLQVGCKLALQVLRCYFAMEYYNNKILGLACFLFTQCACPVVRLQGINMALKQTGSSGAFEWRPWDGVGGLILSLSSLTFLIVTTMPEALPAAPAPHGSAQEVSSSAAWSWKARDHEAGREAGEAEEGHRIEGTSTGIRTAATGAQQEQEGDDVEGGGGDWGASCEGGCDSYHTGESSEGLGGGRESAPLLSAGVGCSQGTLAKSSVSDLIRGRKCSSMCVNAGLNAGGPSISSAPNNASLSFSSSSNSGRIPSCLIVVVLGVVLTVATHPEAVQLEVCACVHIIALTRLTSVISHCIFAYFSHNIDETQIK
jgi:hypothetical protein